MSSILLVIFVSGLGTYLIRAGSLSLGSRIVWPDWAKQWLSFVTPAVLGALLGPTLLLNNNYFIPLAHNAAFVASIPTAITAWFTKNLLVTVTVGVVCFALATRIFGISN